VELNKHGYDSLNSTIESMSSTERGIRVARLMRQCRALGLSEGLWLRLRETIRQEPASNLNVPSDNDQLGWDTKRCELHLRQMMSQGASWSDMKVTAWRRFRLTGTNQSAAQLIELVFLNGSLHETCDVLAVLNEEGFDYYFNLEKKFREHLCFCLWKVNKVETLNIFLGDYTNCNEFLPIEILFVFEKITGAGHEADGYIFFQKYESRLIEAVKKYGDRLQLSLDRFCLKVGKTAIKLGFKEDAHRVLKHIRPDDHLYPDALQILMTLLHDDQDPASHNYLRKLKEKTGWRDRVLIMRGYLSNCRARLSEDDIHRPVVNEIFSKPLKWVPALPVSWKEVSDMIAKNISLSEVLPGLMNLYRETSLIFHTPALDSAIWQPVNECMPRDQPMEYYWHGVALMHQYINSGVGDENTLWKAKELVDFAEDNWSFPLPYKWKELHMALMRGVAKSPHLAESKRQIMLRQLKVVTDDSELSLNEVEEYLDQKSDKSPMVLKQLQKVCQKKKARVLELRVLGMRVAQTNITNNDLNRCWALACELNDYDLAWRVATILESRQSLADGIVNPWMISGEKRSGYPFLSFGKDDLDLCLESFSELERRFCYACLKVGPLIGDLLVALDPHAKVQKPSPISPESFEYQVEKAIEHNKFLAGQRKVYRFGQEGVLASSFQLPGFIQALPSNLWSYLFIRIGECLGLHTWGWKLSKLHAQLEQVLPAASGVYGSKNYPLKVAKWLKGLNPSQKTAWQDLVSLSNKFDDDSAMMVLASFIGKLAIVIHPSHVQALKSLRTMRAPVLVIWEIEKWIASPEYSKIRRSYNIVNRVSVPAQLRDLKSISK